MDILFKSGTTTVETLFLLLRHSSSFFPENSFRILQLWFWFWRRKCFSFLLRNLKKKFGFFFPSKKEKKTIDLYISLDFCKQFRFLSLHLFQLNPLNLGFLKTKKVEEQTKKKTPNQNQKKKRSYLCKNLKVRHNRPDIHLPHHPLLHHLPATTQQSDRREDQKKLENRSLVGRTDGQGWFWPWMRRRGRCSVDRWMDGWPCG